MESITFFNKIFNKECRLFATPCTVARLAPQFMEFSRQKYWSGWPFPSPGDLPDSGIEPGSLALQADSLLSEPPGKPLRRGIPAFPAVWEEGEADITVKT